MKIKTGKEITDELNAIQSKRFHSQSYVEIDELNLVKENYILNKEK